jgi:hypothetical protein
MLEGGGVRPGGARGGLRRRSGGSVAEEDLADPDDPAGVIGANVKMMQSMLFIKSEGKPGQAHSRTDPHPHPRPIAYRRLARARRRDGRETDACGVIPGSHRAGVLYPDREQDHPRFDCTREAYGFAAARRTPCRSSLRPHIRPDGDGGCIR